MLDLENIATCVVFAQGNEPPAGGGLFEMLPLFLIIGLLFYFVLLQPERKRRRQHQEMLERLKKNDRILTGGGIYGTVVSVHKDAGDVTIKVDESSNARMRITRSSIGQILHQDDAKET